MHLLEPRTETTKDRGQAVLELALILPVVVLLIFGALEVGRVLNAWVIVTEAAREGARVAAARCTRTANCGTLVDAGVTSALSGLDLDRSDWSMSGGAYVAGNPVTVDVEYRAPLIVPLISAFFGNNVDEVTVRGRTTMRLE